MAEEIKAEFQRAMEKKRPKTAEIEVDEFEWIQVSKFNLLLLDTTPLKKTAF